MEAAQLAIIAEQAERALFEEVSLTPKPGLVDCLNSGSHSDMDITTFLDSISALAPYFQEYLRAGYEHLGNAKELFYKIRRIGVRAEEDMLNATKNINTHKGANFSFAILLAATGVQLKKGKRFPFLEEDTQNVFLYAKAMSKGLVTADFANLQEKKELSNGERLFLEYGISGIRGEAEQGYPALVSLVLPYLRSYCCSLSKEELYSEALLLLMSEVEDANIIHRGGIAAWKKVKEEAKKLLEISRKEGNLKELLYKYDEVLVSRNLSPGGSADLLALGIYFATVEGIL